MKDFYLTLLSNSSINYFPENKTNSFTVHLPQFLTLTGNWSVCLTEIHYPFTLFNITDKNNSIFIKYKEKQETVHVVKLDIGCYENINDLIVIINDKLLPYTNNKEFISFDQATKRIKINDIKTKNQDAHIENNNDTASLPITNEIEKHVNSLDSIYFENRLAMQLGFAPNENILSYNLSPHAYNLIMGVPEQFFVYCDLIEPQIIGDTSAKVLRIINTTDGSLTFAQSAHKEFNPPHYVSVNEKKIEKISIDIRDASGNFLPFQFGILTIKLHLKKDA